MSTSSLAGPATASDSDRHGATIGHYRLLAKLQPPHQSDVKAVVSIGDSHLASASRDSTVNLWQRSPQTLNDEPFQLLASFGGHNEYVNALAHIPDQDPSSLGLLASGGMSTLILIHNLQSLAPNAEFCLLGHTLNVCALSYSSARKKLISGSWDCTARVWTQSADEWVCELVLEGHDQAVWDVQVFNEGPREGCYLTGSADCFIRLWSTDGKLLERFKGCREPVRSLAILPGSQEFASASNDGLVRIWDLSGSVLAELRGHTNYVYHVTTWGENAGLLSCGEDKTLRVWDSQGNLLVSLEHSCDSVWSVTSFQDGLIATAGSDGFVWIWTSCEPDQSTSEALPTASSLQDDLAEARISPVAA